ncbi:hypothetical protein BD413DRAFT_537298 [Trametes elegans]|nr:hypothetical protein BD413DRAFT_537298 [Trametes elegans]
MKRLSPASLQYAVIRIDPIAMVLHFKDPVATREAQALRPKKYLVYLDLDMDLPFPTSEWFRFRVSPIACYLRAEDPERGLTSDMVIPIYPNPDRPQGRTPIVTQPPFPFHNCYHWVANATTVRVRRKLELYDDTDAVKVSSAEHVRLGMAFWEDYNRMNAAVESQQEENAVDAGSLPPTASAPQSPPRHYHVPSSDDSSTSETSDDEPETPPSGSIRGIQRRNSSVEDLVAMDIFNLAHDDSDETLPLVDLWFDLAEHLSEADIPSPLELEREQLAIANIVREARRRHPEVPVPRRNGELDIDSASESEDDDYTEVSEWDMSEDLEAEVEELASSPHGGGEAKAIDIPRLAADREHDMPHRTSSVPSCFPPSSSPPPNPLATSWSCEGSVHARFCKSNVYKHHQSRV